MTKPLLALAFLILSVPTIAADIPMVIKIPRLTMEAAQKMAQAAVVACRKQGIQIGVTVVDRSGDAMIVLRDTLAPRLTLEASRQKAYTAVNFNATTSSMRGRFTSPFSVAKVEGVLISGGGIPISAVGNIVGAIGVSGAATDVQDEACALAGFKAIELDLEMAGP